MLKFLKNLFGRPEIPHIEGPGTFDQEVVGESHYQSNLKRICGGYKREGSKLRVVAVLVYEDRNQHDDQAIRVDVGGHTVGYLSREDARKYRRRIDKTGNEGITISCDGKVVGGRKTGLFRHTNFGVWLDLPINKL
jgi:hypothetical protein